MAVLPLLMLSTGSVQAAWTARSPRPGSTPSKAWPPWSPRGVLDALTTQRRALSLDHVGGSPGQFALADGDAPGLAHRLHEQAVVLTSSDLYYVMGGVAVALILLIFWMPTRIFPPRAPT